MINSVMASATNNTAGNIIDKQVTEYGAKTGDSLTAKSSGQCELAVSHRQQLIRRLAGYVAPYDLHDPVTNRRIIKKGEPITEKVIFEYDGDGHAWDSRLSNFQLEKLCKKLGV